MPEMKSLNMLCIYLKKNIIGKCVLSFTQNVYILR